jgi:hypothetical protein
MKSSLTVIAQRAGGAATEVAAGYAGVLYRLSQRWLMREPIA